VNLTVVLPFYNEEALLPSLDGLLESLRKALDGHAVRFLAIDDGSTDGTAAGLTALPEIEVLTHDHNRGVGAAMATGIGAATGDAVLIYDPDAGYHPETPALLVAALTGGEGADVATLSPYHPDGSVEGVSPMRLLLSRAASALYRRALRSELRTFTCAVRAYRIPEVRRLLPCPEDFTAAAFLMAAALREGLRVTEVPATLRARAKGRSKMRLLSTIRAHLRLLRDLKVTAKGSKDRP
jgi:dolichol-phosphate mannosyltransferase